MSDEVIVRQCSPTLAGIKTGNLFTVGYESVSALRGELRRLNCRLRAKGLLAILMRCGEGRALVYLYRPSRLDADLRDCRARDILSRRGYECSRPAKCLAQLARRLREEGEFPHEIGLFLSYPPEDVQGFMENRAANCKCSGCWKVYGSEQRALQEFERYRRCTDAYCRRYADGSSIEQLAVSGG